VISDSSIEAQRLIRECSQLQDIFSAIGACLSSISRCHFLITALENSSLLKMG
jgi:hypothetical protein